MSPPPRRPVAQLSPVPDDLRDLRERDSRYDPADDDAGGRSRGVGRWLVVALVVALIAGVAGGYLTGRQRPEPSSRWLTVAFPGAGTPAGPVLAELGADAPAPSRARLAATLGPLLGDPKLGGHVTASVVDVATGETLLDRQSEGAVVPASTTKLATGAAVLAARGPGHRIPTRVVAGATPGEVVLVGGGDPTLAVNATGTYPGAGRLDKLAEQVTKALGATTPTRVVVDASLFGGPTVGPGWYAGAPDDGFISHITALMTDGARQNPRDVEGAAKRHARPDLAAGQAFAKALGLPPSAVVVTPGAAAEGARQLGEVLSPPVSRLVEIMLQESDNVVAEALARQVALARGRPATFAGASDAMREALAEAGVTTAGYGLVDGSGMSHQNKLSAGLLTSILAVSASAEHPELRSVTTGLPVAGYSGTLMDRFRLTSAGAKAAGTVRAKTGTLTGISSLAGLVVDADGRLLSFAVVADQVGNTAQAQAALDRVAAAIAACGCR